MKIAVASGKGGTGKTTVATNLAVTAALEGYDVQYLDCDVEEPNGHLFLKPQWETSRVISIPVPTVDDSLCTACGECGKFCEFNALACIADKVLTFPELCHACGGCFLVCPAGAIRESRREIGVVESGAEGLISFTHGRLRIGEAMPVPLIRAVKETIEADMDLVLLDSPPGTGCPVVETVRDADFVMLVTEPTPFGLWDLGLALDMITEMGRPHGIVVNRHSEGNKAARSFAKERGVTILAEIPDDRRVAEAYSRGEIALNAVSGFRRPFVDLLVRLENEVREGIRS